MVEGTAARGAALEILRRVRQGQLFATARETAVRDLKGADRRLAHEIAAGVLRQRTLLDRRLRPLVSGSWRRTPPDLKDLLRIGAFQIEALDRVPAYGAVQATVEIAKREQGQRGAGLVNAVLRHVAAGTQPQRSSVSDSAHTLADEYSHPGWLVDRWVAAYGKERTAALLAHNNRRPRIVLQPMRWTGDQLHQSLVQQEIDVVNGPLGYGFAVRGTRIERLPGFREGAFIVQDSAQTHMLTEMGFADGESVWDACAAPGGKTAVLSRRCRVMASDLRRERIRQLHDTLGRVSTGVVTFVADAVQSPVRPGSVDTILIDAPCTATGTFARHPDARWRITPKRLQSAARLQREILDGVAPLVGQGGSLVYLTCSLEHEENASQVDAFLVRHPQFQRAIDDVFVFPPDAGTDGAYGARLSRVR